MTEHTVLIGSLGLLPPPLPLLDIPSGSSWLFGSVKYCSMVSRGPTVWETSEWAESEVGGSMAGALEAWFWAIPRKSCRGLKLFCFFFSDSGRCSTLVSVLMLRPAAVNTWRMNNSFCVHRIVGHKQKEHQSKDYSSMGSQIELMWVYWYLQTRGVLKTITLYWNCVFIQNHKGYR